MVFRLRLSGRVNLHRSTAAVLGAAILLSGCSLATDSLWPSLTGVEPSGTPCSPDTDECTADICDGVNVFCTHPDNGLCGACCLVDWSCRDDFIESTCNGLGGTFVGAAVDCGGDSDGDGVVDHCDLCPGVDDFVFGPGCVNAIPTVSEWGMVILALLLLTGGKVYFSRRLHVTS